MNAATMPHTQSVIHRAACHHRVARQGAVVPVIAIILGVLYMTSPAPVAQPNAPCRQWRPAQFHFQSHGKDDDNPFAISLTTTFTGPGGESLRVPGFWNGERTWCVRVAPTAPGRWSYETSAEYLDLPLVTAAYASPVMSGADPARRVDIPLDGAAELHLLVHAADNSSDYDHADWADACLVATDGEITYLDAVEPAAATQGHGNLGRGTNIPGDPLRIGTRTFDHGLGSHSPGRIVYRLEPRHTRFQAWIGVDELVGDRGSVRFEVLLARPSPERAGTHVPGLHGQTGAFEAVPAAADNPLFAHGGFLRASADGHHLTYTDGTPFFWLGDTWWFCPSDLMPIDTETHPGSPPLYRAALRTRAEQRFTVVHMAFLHTISGVNPFSSAAGIPSLDPEYWHTVDRYIETANRHGIIPVIGMGWKGDPLDETAWRQLWRHMVARCGSFAVTWLVCGEYNLRPTPEQIRKTLAVGAFIKSVDPYKRAMTIHPWAYGGDRRQAWDQPWYDIIMFQGGHGSLPPAELYMDAYSHSPHRPVIEGECRYEGIHAHRDAEIRQAAYRAIQAGCAGYTYGSHGLWYPTQNENDTRFDEWGKPTPWWEALARPGAPQLGIMRTIYERVPWWRLKPCPEALVADIPGGDGDHLTIVWNAAARFADAHAVNEHWCRLEALAQGGAAAQAIHLHPTTDGPASLRFDHIALPPLSGEQRLLLLFATAISPNANIADPAHPSDGVTFAVSMNDRQLTSRHCHSHEWHYHAVDISDRAGHPSSIQFQVAAGQNMNWDHAVFRQPVIARVPRDLKEPLKDTYTRTETREVFAKTDGDGCFLVYISAGTGVVARRLQDLPHGASCNASWHNPRTGEASADMGLVADATGLPLPEPPDAQDWVLILRQTRPQ